MSTEFEEGQVVSKEYKGEQGRFMPPKHEKPAKFHEDEVWSAWFLMVTSTDIERFLKCTKIHFFFTFR